MELARGMWIPIPHLWLGIEPIQGEALIRWDERGNYQVRVEGAEQVARNHIPIANPAASIPVQPDDLISLQFGETSAELRIGPWLDPSDVRREEEAQVASTDTSFLEDDLGDLSDIASTTDGPGFRL